MIYQEFWNKIYLKDSRNMDNIPDNSVNLMVTSPPYNVTKQYDDNLTLREYLDLIRAVHREVKRVLIPGGIIALNIANVGRKPYIPLDCFFIEILEDLGFEIIQEIIWDKAASAGGSCAWGSWKSASNPSLRDVHEYIIIAQKPPITPQDQSYIKLTREKLSQLPEKIDNKSHTMDQDNIFSNLWVFGTESATRVNHPAPFRVELPYRIIQMFTNEGDLILDPFMGSGSTALAAIISDRRYIGFEINSDYLAIAERRIDEYFHPEKKRTRIKNEKLMKQRQKRSKIKNETNNKAGKGKLPDKTGEKVNKRDLMSFI